MLYFSSTHTWVFLLQIKSPDTQIVHLTRRGAGEYYIINGALPVCLILSYKLGNVDIDRLLAVSPIMMLRAYTPVSEETFHYETTKQ